LENCGRGGSYENCKTRGDNLGPALLKVVRGATLKKQIFLGDFVVNGKM
jgi:hypothetical protein